MSDLTIPQRDVLLCLLHAGAKPGYRWMTLTSLIEDHYGKAQGRAVQGRNQAMRNILFNLCDEGLVRIRTMPESGMEVRMTTKALDLLYPWVSGGR